MSFVVLIALFGSLRIVLSLGSLLVKRVVPLFGPFVFEVLCWQIIVIVAARGPVPALGLAQHVLVTRIQLLVQDLGLFPLLRVLLSFLSVSGEDALSVGVLHQDGLA